MDPKKSGSEEEKNLGNEEEKKRKMKSDADNDDEGSTASSPPPIMILCSYIFDLFLFTPDPLPFFPFLLAFHPNLFPSLSRSGARSLYSCSSLAERIPLSLFRRPTWIRLSLIRLAADVRRPGTIPTT